MDRVFDVYSEPRSGVLGISIRLDFVSWQGEQHKFRLSKT